MPTTHETTVMPQGAIPRLGAIKEKKGVPHLKTGAATGLDIIDIRHAAVEINLKTEVLAQFRAADGPRKLPTLLLYDERGLQLFEKVRRGSAMASSWRRGHPTLIQGPTTPSPRLHTWTNTT